MDNFIYIFIFMFIGLGIFAFYFLKKLNDNTKKIDEMFNQDRKLFDMEKEIITKTTDAQVKIIDEHKKQILNAIVEARREISETKITSEKLKTVIENNSQVTNLLQNTTDKLRDILANNQSRGLFGQEIAEDLLKMSGFVKDVNYVVQKTQEGQEGNNRPDITMLLPDNSKLNVDVKFPFQALQRLKETSDEIQQAKYEAEFKADIKARLFEVKKYINPKENTLDFVIIFIPNEMIFSYIYDKHPDLWKEALRDKIILSGPLSFIAILRMVQQSYDNFRYNKNLHTIINLIKSFEKEFSKFDEQLNSLGDKINSVTKAYENLSVLRTRQLTKIIEKIMVNDLPSSVE